MFMIWLLSWEYSQKFAEFLTRNTNLEYQPIYTTKRDEKNWIEWVDITDDYYDKFISCDFYSFNTKHIKNVFISTWHDEQEWAFYWLPSTCDFKDKVIFSKREIDFAHLTAWMKERDIRYISVKPMLDSKQNEKLLFSVKMKGWDKFYLTEENINETFNTINKTYGN